MFLKENSIKQAAQELTVLDITDLIPLHVQPRKSSFPQKSSYRIGAMEKRPSRC